jgi:hypothetical protein
MFPVEKSISLPKFREKLFLTLKKCFCSFFFLESLFEATPGKNNVVFGPK